MNSKYIISGAGAFVVLIFLLFISSGPDGWRKYYLESHYEGRVVNRFMDYGMKSNEVIIVVGDEQKHILGNHAVFTRLDTGDYVIKKAGTLQYCRIKKSSGDTIIFYPQGYNNTDTKANAQDK